MRTRLWFAFLTFLLVLPVAVFGGLLVTTTVRITLGHSNDYVGVVILSILLVLLGPLLLGPARSYCIGTWTGSVPAEVLTGRGLHRFWQWFSVARLILAGLFGILALSYLALGQFLPAGFSALSALGFGAKGLERLRRPSRVALLRGIAGLWMVVGLVFLIVALDGLLTAETGQIAGGVLLWGSCTLIGLAFLLLARRASGRRRSG